MRKLLLGVLIVVILLIAAALFIHGNNDTTDTTATPSTNQTQSTSNSTTTSTPNDTSEIEIDDFAFQPATLSVKKGTKVTWKNKDSAAHTVTVDNSSLAGPKSGTLNTGDSYTFNFDTVGTFAYHCTFHTNMKATVVVAE